MTKVCCPEASNKMAFALPNPQTILSGAWNSLSSRIYLLTWNVHGKAPPNDVVDLLQLRESSSFLPAIYAIGLQESGMHDWDAVFTSALAPHDYVKIKVRRLLGMITLLFVKRSHLNYMTSIESEVTKTGLGGYWGNKGASSIRFDFMGMNIIVVNSHLAAHMEDVGERLLHVDSILDDHKFRDADTDNVMDHDYVFWMGDLNFRIENTSFNRTLDLIRERDYKTLITNDQLHIVMEEGLAFMDFKEGDINFPPTYKFDPGTDHYDTSEKQRIPSYTDRILYHCHNTNYGSISLQTKVLSYRNHPNYRQSDHRPVSALFEITVMKKGIANPVAFEEFDLPWSGQQSMDVNYTVRRDFCITGSDWIGLYKGDFVDFDSYCTYVWASTSSESSSPSSVALKVRFDCGQLSGLRPGSYFLCYLTKKYSLCGISSRFLIG